MAKTAVTDATRLNAFAIEPERLVIIDDPKHHLYDERVKLPLDEALVRNIMVHGVKVPVLVAKEGNSIIVFDGRQRVKAAIEANKRLKEDGSEQVKVKIFIERGDEADLFGVCILANEMRQEDSIILKARKAKRLLDMNGGDVGAAAATFGVSKIQIERWLKLTDLAAPVVKAIESGEITATAAVELAGLSRDEQVEALEKLKVDAPKDKKGAAKPVSVKHAKKAAKSKAAAKTKDPISDAPAEPEQKFDRPSLRDLKRVHSDQRLTEEDQRLLGWVLGYVSAEEAGVEHLLKEDEKEAKAEAKE